MEMLSRLKEMLNPEGCVAVHLIEGKENLYTALKYVYSKVFELVRVSSVEGLASKVLFAKDCSVCFIRTYSIHDKHNLGFKTSTSLNSQQIQHSFHNKHTTSKNSPWERACCATARSCGARALRSPGARAAPSATCSESASAIIASPSAISCATPAPLR